MKILFQTAILIFSFSLANARTEFFNDFIKVNKQLIVVGGLQNAGEKRRAALLMTSENDGQWTAIKLPPSPSAPLKAIAYGKGKFVAVGGEIVTAEPTWFKSHVIFTSSDGASWKSSEIPNFDSFFDDLVFFKDRFIAIDSEGYIWLSIDGSDWKKQNKLEIGFRPKFTSIPEKLIVTGEGNALFMSEDGETWKSFSVGEDPRSLRITAVASLKKEIYGILYFDCCFGEMPENNQTFWFNLGVDSAAALHEVLPKGMFISALSVFKNGFVGLSGDKIVTSPDLQNWNSTEFTSGLNFQKVLVTDAGIYVLESNHVLFSSDAKTWKTIYGNPLK